MFKPHADKSENGPPHCNHFRSDSLRRRPHHNRHIYQPVASNCFQEIHPKGCSDFSLRYRSDACFNIPRKKSRHFYKQPTVEERSAEIWTVNQSPIPQNLLNRHVAVQKRRHHRHRIPSKQFCAIQQDYHQPQRENGPDCKHFRTRRRLSNLQNLAIAILNCRVES